MDSHDSPRMTGGSAVVEQLEREGVERVFGIPGVHTLDIYDALIDSEIDHVTTRHEQGAGFMADGYARATGRVGVMLLITGPGLTNAATPIAQAYSDSSPVLVVSSDNETNERGRGKGLLHELKDQEGVMESMTAYSETVDRVGDIPDAIADAFEYLRSHRPRAVHVQVPIDVLGRTDAVSPSERNGASIPHPDEDRLDDAFDRLDDASRPVLIAGGGAVGAAAHVRRFVDRTGIPVVTTVAGKGVVPESHDCSLGARFREDAVAEFVENCDFALAIGTELSPLDLRGTELPETVVHVDVDYAAIGRNRPVDVGIVGDAASAVRGLLDRLERRQIAVDDRVRKSLEAVREAVERPALDADDDRNVILAALREGLDEDAIVVFDMTKLGYAGRRLFPVEEPGTFVFPRGYGTLGFSPPAAFGAAVGSDDRQVAAVVGDGGFMFTVQDLATAVKYDLSVPVIVCNDDGYGVIGDHQRREYGRTIADDIENPDFVDLARSFGAAGTRVPVENVATGLPEALEEAFDRSRPTVIEIPVDF